MAFKLSKRLETIASMVDENAYIADIGADHGHLPLALIQSGKISYAMAVENKMGPYLNLKHNVDAAGLSSRIYLSLSDGISTLNDGVDTLILAGMGGRLSIDILSAHPESLAQIHTIILDPHRDLKKIRSYVAHLGFIIQDETMVKEDRIYYSIIKFVRGELARPYSEDELLFGPKIMEKLGDTFYSYLRLQQEKVERLLEGKLSKESEAKYRSLLESIRTQLARYPNALDRQ